MGVLKRNRLRRKIMARTRCEIWSRVVGYLRPTSRWNEGKLAEFKDRKMFNIGGDK